MYGLAAIFELHKQKSQKPVQIKEISAKANIPQNYLEQLLSILRKAGIVKSTRGAHGGYLLAKSTNDITVKEIFEALEGDLLIIEPVSSDPALRLFYSEYTKKLENLFDISLEELLKYQQKATKHICYTI